MFRSRLICVPALVLLFCLPVLALAAPEEGSWELAVCADAANLPFSDRSAEGFENHIAAVLAEELGAELRYVWIEPPLLSRRNYLIQSGACDVLMALPDGHPDFLTSIVYYRSIYAFTAKTESSLSDLESLDDERLHDLRIGVQSGGGAGISAITQSLALRGLIPNQVSFVPDHGDVNPLLRLPQAVLAGEVDIAIVWGPVAGYSAARADGELTVHSVQPEIDEPFTPLFENMTVGVRPGDEALRDALNSAIAARWEDIQEILRDFDVLTMPVPAPQLGR